MLNIYAYPKNRSIHVCNSALFDTIIVVSVQATTFQKLSIHLRTLQKHVQYDFILINAQVVSQILLVDKTPLRHALSDLHKFWIQLLLMLLFVLSSFLASWRNWAVIFLIKVIFLLSPESFNFLFEYRKKGLLTISI